MPFVNPSSKHPHCHLPDDANAALWAACQVVDARRQDFSDALSSLNDVYSQAAVCKQLLAESKRTYDYAMIKVREGEFPFDTFGRQEALRQCGSDKKLLKTKMKGLRQATIRAAMGRGWRMDGDKIATRNAGNEKNVVTDKDVETVWKWRDEYGKDQIQGIEDRRKEWDTRHRVNAKDRAWRLRQAIEAAINKDLPAGKETLDFARRGALGDVDLLPGLFEFAGRVRRVGLEERWAFDVATDKRKAACSGPRVSIIQRRALLRSEGQGQADSPGLLDGEP